MFYTIIPEELVEVSSATRGPLEDALVALDTRRHDASGQIQAVVVVAVMSHTETENKMIQEKKFRD